MPVPTTYCGKKRFWYKPLKFCFIVMIFMWNLHFPILTTISWLKARSEIALLKDEVPSAVWNNVPFKENAPLLPPHSLLTSKTVAQQSSQGLVWGNQKAFWLLERQLDQAVLGAQAEKGYTALRPLVCLSRSVVKDKSAGGTSQHWAMEQQDTHTECLELTGISVYSAINSWRDSKLVVHKYFINSTVHRAACVPV